MKKFLIATVIMCTSFSLLAASSSGRRGINTSSWSLLYGYSENINKKDYKPGGASYKFLLGYRFDNNCESNFLLGFSDQIGDITYSGIEGNIKRKSVSYGLQFGYWIFSALKLHVGYAFHGVTHTLSGAYSANQETTINKNYGLENSSPKGLMGGVDLALLQSQTFQLYANYDYYRLNHQDAHDWEAMVGIRIYPGPSKGGSESSFFGKLMDWIVKDKK